MVKVKICGITNFEDAMASVDAGCEALGFVFYEKSPRYISPQKAKDIIVHLPPHVIKMGVFVNADEKFIRDTAELCGLDMLQFHGEESPEFCERFKTHKIIKAFRVKPQQACPIGEDKALLKNVLQYHPFAYLFDTFSETEAGGTGKKFDWKTTRYIDSLTRPVFLSGGLTAGNVLEAIKCAQPDWVDVSSSLESSPGKKDHKKIKEFVDKVKRAEQ